MIRLVKAKAGGIFYFNSCEGGDSAMAKLADMGLLPGERIKVINNTGIGPVTLEIKGSKVAIGHGLARKIMVEEGNYDRK